MSSSSELEILPVKRRVASPPQPRRSGRERRAPRGVDEVASAAAPLIAIRPNLVQSGHSDTAPAKNASHIGARKRIRPTVDERPVGASDLSTASGSSTPLAVGSKSAAPRVRALLLVPTSAAELAPARSSSPFTTAGPAAPGTIPSGTSPSSGPSTAPPTTILQSATRRSASAPDRAASTSAAAPRAAPPTNYSSDETDDFFDTRGPRGRARVLGSTSTATNSMPATTVGKAPAKRARLPSRAGSGSATPGPTSPAKRPRPATLDLVIPSSSSSDTEPPARNRFVDSRASDSDDAGPRMTKGLKLPAWARTGSTAGGVERNRLSKKLGKNRKTEQRGEIGREADAMREEIDEKNTQSGTGAMLEGELPRWTGNGKGKGKAVDGGDGTSDTDADTDDSLELALGAESQLSPRRRIQRRPLLPALTLPSSPPRSQSPRNPSRSEVIGDVRLNLHHVHTRDPANTNHRASESDPGLLQLQDAPKALPVVTHIFLASASSDRDSVGPSHVVIDDNGNGEDEDEEPIDVTLAAIRSSLAAARRTASTETSGSQRASALSPFDPATDTQLNGTEVGRVGRDKNPGTVRIRLRMVFDPTQEVSEMIRSAYEREEAIDIGVHEPFELLFTEVSKRRFVPRDNLVIAHLRDPPAVPSNVDAVSSSFSASRHAQIQLFEFGTPASLSLSAGQEAHMRGYTADVWAKVRDAIKRERKADQKRREEAREELELEKAAAEAARRVRGAGKVIDLLADNDDDPDDSGGQATGRMGDAACGDPRDPGPSALPSSDAAGPSATPHLFPLTLRGSRTQSLSLAVKPSTTMALLVRAFCRHFSTPANDLALRQAQFVIEFDGDRLDGTMTLEEAKAEFDLEGEETFELREIVAP